MVQRWHVNGLARVILGLLLAGWTASAAGSKQQEPNIETKRDSTELQTVRCDRHLAGVDFSRVVSVILADNSTGSEHCLAKVGINWPHGESCPGHRQAVKGYYNYEDRMLTFVKIMAAKTATDDLSGVPYVCISDGGNERQTWGGIAAVTWEQADMFDCLVRSDDNNTHYSIKFKMQNGGSEARVVAPDSSSGPGVAGYSVFRLSEQSFTAADSPVLYSMFKWPGYARLVVVVSANVTAAYDRMTCEVEESSGKSWTREYSRPDDDCLGITTPSGPLRSPPDGKQPDEDTCGKFCVMIALACSVLAAVIVMAIAIAVYCIKKQSPRSPSHRNGTEGEDEIDLLCNRKAA